MVLIQEEVQVGRCGGHTNLHLCKHSWFYYIFKMGSTPKANTGNQNNGGAAYTVDDLTVNVKDGITDMEQLKA